MVKKWLIYLILFLLAVNIALVSTLLIQNNKKANFEERLHPDALKHRHRSGFEEHLAYKLGLNDAQRTEVKTFSEEFRKNRKANFDQMQLVRKQFFEVLSTENPDTVLLSTLAQKIGLLEAKKIKQEYMHYRNIRSVCNAEQALRLDSLGRLQMHKHLMRKDKNHARYRGDGFKNQRHRNKD
jgi:hypothetical protein